MANVNIHHRVSQIPQPRGSTKCWAACGAMVMHRRGSNVDAVVNAVVDEARRGGVALTLTDALLEAGVGRFASLFGFSDWQRPAGAMVIDPATFAAKLQRGPVIALGERLVQGPGEHQNHAVVLDGLRGDTEAPVHILLHGVDPLVPAGGGAFERSVTGFQNYLRVLHLLSRG